MTAQACEVDEAQLSVRTMMESGHSVTSSKGGSYIIDYKTGESMQLQDKHGMLTREDLGDDLGCLTSRQREDCVTKQFIRPRMTEALSGRAA